MEGSNQNINQDNQIVSNIENGVSSNTIKIDPFASSNMDLEENVEEPVIEQVIEENHSPKKSKKNLFIIVGLAFVILIVMITLFVLLFRPKKNHEAVEMREVVEDTSFYGILKDSMKQGEFQDEVSVALKEISSNASKLYFIPIDIDSDEDLELVAYVDDETKYLIQFEMTDGVYFEDSFELDSFESFGYAYSLDDNRCCWFTESKDYVTLIQNRKTVLKKEDFLKQYYVVSNDFVNKITLEDFLSYNLGAKLDVELLEKQEITEKKLFEENQLTLLGIREKVMKQLEEKAAAEAEALKQKEAEEQKKDIFDLNGVLLHYGKYVEETHSGLGDFTINRDGTCLLGERVCTWSYSKYTFEDTEQQAICIHLEGAELYISSWKSNSVSNGDGWSSVYQG